MLKRILDNKCSSQLANDTAVAQVKNSVLTKFKNALFALAVFQSYNWEI